MELATVLDRLAVDALVTEYARAVAGGDPEVCRPLCVPGAVLDDPVLDARKGAEGQAVPRQRGSDKGPRPYQHLIVNRKVTFERREGEVGDLAVVDADFVTPMRSNGPGRIADTVRGGRYRIRGVRTAEGWRLSEVVAEEVWQGGAPPAGGN
ncbi:nuclear transport factor 2 family protein [Streptomyces sp. NPDC058374]|uniref:nuclear transport factor 2 family protein n=1 Tax=Streptomyces sp. NPDC058374 TaxID=3346466 RepID=UPI00365B868B